MRGHAAGGGAGSGHAAGHEGEAPVCVPEDRCSAPGMRAAHGGPGMGTYMHRPVPGGGSGGSIEPP